MSRKLENGAEVDDHGFVAFQNWDFVITTRTWESVFEPVRVSDFPPPKPFWKVGGEY